MSFVVSTARADGYVVRDGRADSDLDGSHRDAPARADGLPVAARYVLDDALEVESEVLGLVAIPLTGPGAERAVLARGLCNFEVGRTQRPRIGQELIGQQLIGQR